MARLKSTLMRSLRCVTLLGAIAACGLLEPPETGFTPSEAARQAPYPTLLQQPTLDAVGLTALAPRTATDPLQSRVAALQARAAALNGPVLAPETRSRLSDAAAAAPF